MPRLSTRVKKSPVRFGSAAYVGEQKCARWKAKMLLVHDPEFLKKFGDMYNRISLYTSEEDYGDCTIYALNLLVAEGFTIIETIDTDVEEGPYRRFTIYYHVEGKRRLTPCSPDCACKNRITNPDKQTLYTMRPLIGTKLN